MQQILWIFSWAMIFSVVFRSMWFQWLFQIYWFSSNFTHVTCSPTFGRLYCYWFCLNRVEQMESTYCSIHWLGIGTALLSHHRLYDVPVQLLDAPLDSVILHVITNNPLSSLRNVGLLWKDFLEEQNVPPKKASQLNENVFAF